MRYLHHILLCVSLTLVVFLPVSADRVELPPVDDASKVENPPESLRLEYKFDVGEIRRYDITVTGQGFVKLPGQKEKAKFESNSDLTFTQHVTAHVPAEEVWRMDWDMIKGVMTIPEFGEMVLTIPSLELEMDKYGAIRKMKGLENLALTPGLPQQSTMGDVLGQLKFLGFPQKPVRVDDTWEQEYAIQIPDQDPLRIKVTSKLTGYERVDEKDCAKITATYEAPFKLQIKKGDENKPSAGGDDGKAEPLFFVGKEKGERHTYFIYGEGRILQSYATIELIADVQSDKKPAEAKPDEIKPPPADESAAQKQEQEEMQKHDLALKYTLVSHYNPKLPETARERKKK
jgi:hypothetical protein